MKKIGLHLNRIAKILISYDKSNKWLNIIKKDLWEKIFNKIENSSIIFPEKFNSFNQIKNAEAELEKIRLESFEELRQEKEISSDEEIFSLTNLLKNIETLNLGFDKIRLIATKTLTGLIRYLEENIIFESEKIEIQKYVKFLFIFANKTKEMKEKLKEIL